MIQVLLFLSSLTHVQPMQLPQQLPVPQVQIQKVVQVELPKCEPMKIEFNSRSVDSYA